MVYDFGSYSIPKFMDVLGMNFSWEAIFETIVNESFIGMVSFGSISS